VEHVILIGVVIVVTLMLGSQLLVRQRAKRMTGAPLPALPADFSGRVPATGRALLYFFSPSCAACRAITPRIRVLEATRRGVVAVDVTIDSGVAQALGVMATPSTVEIDNGVITGFHVGAIPAAVLARFTS